jgi:hypothetical protein
MLNELLEVDQLKMAKSYVVENVIKGSRRSESCNCNLAACHFIAVGVSS